MIGAIFLPILLAMIFWSAAEQHAPGVTLAVVKVAAEMNADPHLPQELAAAVATKGSAQ
jgi:hypothetical protein